MIHLFNSSFLLTIIVLINLLTVLAQQKQSLRISPFGESVNQPANQQFVLTCKGEGGEPNWFSNLKWFDPRGEEITPTYTRDRNPDIRVEELQLGNVLLHFLKPTPDDTGLYKCKGTFQHSDALEAQIQINFFQDVTWDDCPEIQALIKGNSGERIRCKASANPKPNIVWTKEGVQLEGDPRYNIDSNGIRINDAVNDKDGGVFRVRALVTETGRVHDKYITVQVYVRPQILQFPDHFEGTEDEQASLKCEASGNPEPIYTWLDPNRRNLSSVGGYNVDRNNGLLMISKVRRFEDNGTFTCIAENSAGRDERTTKFLVLRRPKIASFQNQSFDENKESLLECRVTGDPRPDIEIRKDGNSRPFVTGDPRVRIEQKIENEETVLRLWIINTERSDDGLYFCTAKNKGGTAERVGHLEVRFAPDLKRTPLTTVKTWDAHPVNITCIADSIPNATIKWYYRGQELLNGYTDVYKIVDNSAGVSQLFINPLASPGGAHRDIYGVYRCEGSNSLGRSDINIQLDQAFRPGAIMQVTHEKITPTTITFKLFGPSADGGLPIKKIHVQYREEEHVSWDSMQTRSWPATNTIAGTTYFLDNLRPRTRYIFRFAAENDVGIGDFSAEKALMTERESHPDKPQFHNLPFDTINKNEIISPFSDKFVATWNLPPDNGREIRYFEIKYYPVIKTDSGFEPKGIDQKLESVSMSDESMTSYTLKNLKPSTYYRIELRAYNDLGFSDTESVVFRTSSTDQGIIEDNEDSFHSSLQTSSVSLGLIIGIVIVLIIILLIIMDVTFFIRYKVGAFYFLRTHVCNASETSPNHKVVKSDEQMTKSDNKSVVQEIDNPAFDSRNNRTNSVVNDELSPMINRNNLDTNRAIGLRNTNAKDSAV